MFRFIHRLDAHAASWMVATLLVMALLPVHVSIGTVYSAIYTPIDSASSSVSSSCFWSQRLPTSSFVHQLKSVTELIAFSISMTFRVGQFSLSSCALAL